MRSTGDVNRCGLRVSSSGLMTSTFGISVDPPEYAILMLRFSFLHGVERKFRLLQSVSELPIIGTACGRRPTSLYSTAFRGRVADDELLNCNQRSEERRVGKECRSRWS